MAPEATAPPVPADPDRGSGPQPDTRDDAPPSAFDLPPADLRDPYGPRPGSATRLTRTQIVGFALENPLVKAAAAKTEAMEALLRKAKFAWIPVIQTTATLAPGANIVCDDVQLQQAGSTDTLDFQWCRPPAEDTDTDFNIQTIQGYFQQIRDAGIRLSFDADALFPIYTFGKIRNAKKAAKAGVALAKLAEEQARAETVLRVHQAHTALLLARESIRILEEAQRVLSHAKERVEKDLGGNPDDWAADLDAVNANRDPDDLFRVVLADVELEQLMRQALKIEGVSLASLWALAGSAAPTGFDIAETRLAQAEITDGGLKPMGHYVEVARHQRPEAKMAEGMVAVRRAQEKLSRSNFLPDLGLLVRVGVGYANAADPDMGRIYYSNNLNYSRIVAALVLNWRWDFHNRTFDLQRARAELRESQAKRDAAHLLLAHEVQTSYLDLVEADQRVDLLQTASDVSWKLVISEEQDDIAGVGDNKDLLRSLERWYQWRFKYMEALQTHNVALAQLSRAVGMALEAPPPQALD